MALSRDRRAAAYPEVAAVSAGGSAPVAAGHSRRDGPSLGSARPAGSPAADGSPRRPGARLGAMVSPFPRASPRGSPGLWLSRSVVPPPGLLLPGRARGRGLGVRGVTRGVGKARKEPLADRGGKKRY